MRYDMIVGRDIKLTQYSRSQMANSRMLSQDWCRFTGWFLSFISFITTRLLHSCSVYDACEQEGIQWVIKYAGEKGPAGAAATEAPAAAATATTATTAAAPAPSAPAAPAVPAERKA
jgi:hypothetical protein